MKPMKAIRGLSALSPAGVAAYDLLPKRHALPHDHVGSANAR